MRLAASACSRRERPNTRTCEQGVFAHVRMFACSRRIPASPLEAVLNRRIIACSGIRTTAVFARKTSLYLFSAKSTDRSLRLVFFAAFWSAKSGAKTDPPTKKAKRRGLTLAPGARLKGGFKGRWTAERVISDTTLSLLKPASYAGARAFSRAFVSRLRHRAGIVRRGTRREEVQNGPFRNLKPRFLTGRRTGRRAGRSCQSQCKSRFLTGRTREQG